MKFLDRAQDFVRELERPLELFEEAEQAPFDLAHLCHEILLLARGEPSRRDPKSDPLARAEYLCRLLVESKEHIKLVVGLAVLVPASSTRIEVAAALGNNYHEAIAALATQIVRAIEINKGFGNGWPTTSRQLAMRPEFNLIVVQNALQWEQTAWRNGIAEALRDADNGKPAAPKVVSPQWDKVTEARNKFVYDECVKGTVYKKIIVAVKKRKTWEPLNTTNAVKRAAFAYAERKGLPLPPTRQRGRLANA